MTLYLLEILVTGKDKIVCEPLGIYTSYRKAEKYLDLIDKTLPKSGSSMLNIIPFDPDEEPSILKMRKTSRKRIAEDLLSLYKDEVFQQMVETDGTFSYVVSPKYQKLLEKAIFNSSDVDKDKK